MESLRGAIALLAFAAASPLAAQTEWTMASPTMSPPARYGHAMVTDTGRDRVVMFGGAGAAGLLADTWEWDGADWRPIVTTHTPTARSRHAMAWDSVRQRVVLFGGNGSAGPLGDTWEFDGQDWQVRAPAQSPVARRGHALAYDSTRQRTVLFGGEDGAGLRNDGWEFDGSTWTEIQSAHRPPPRAGHAMAYDPSLRQLLLFGGCDAVSLRQDTWVLFGTDWSQAYVIQWPGARSGHAMAFHPQRRRIVLSGGYPSFGDSWEWDGANWYLQPNQVPAGQRTTDQAMAYHAATDRIVAFGGTLQNTGATDLTQLYRSIHPATFTTLGHGCPGANGTPGLELGPWSLPWAADFIDLRVTNVPAGALTALVLGWNNRNWNGVPLPFDMTPFGAPQCELYLRPLSLQILVGTGTVPKRIYVPPLPQLTGLVFYQQALLAFAGTASPSGLAASPAGACTLGWR